MDDKFHIDPKGLNLPPEQFEIWLKHEEKRRNSRNGLIAISLVVTFIGALAVTVIMGLFGAFS